MKLSQIFHRSQSTHFAADGLRSVHRHPSGGRALLVGAHPLRDRRIQRWPGRPARPHASSTDAARPVPRSHRRQASAEHDVSGAVDPAQDSVEIHGAGLQPRHFDFGGQRRAVRDCRTAGFPPQHFRKGEHLLADQRGVSSCSCWKSRPLRWVWIARTVFLRATFMFTIVSALHYVILVQQRLRRTYACPAAGARSGLPDQI